LQLKKVALLEQQCQDLQLQLMSSSQRAANAALEQYKKSDEMQALLENQFKKGEAQGAVNALREHRGSEEFASILSAEYAKGKIAGAAEELQRFHITYTPVIVDHETFFSHKIDGGFEMQLHYSGFPIGEPTRRITSHQEKSKDENINQLLEYVDKTLEIAAAAATKMRIPITIGKTTKRIGKK